MKEELYKEDEIKINPVSTYLDPGCKSLEDVKNWILIALGHPLITIELDDTQLNWCISRGMEIYTKYAMMKADQYLTVDLNNYEHGKGLDLHGYDIISIKDIALPRDNMFAQGGDIFWSPYAYLGQGNGIYPFHNASNLPTMGGWVTWHAVNEFFDMSKRLTGSNPDFQYDKGTQMLRLMPEPPKNKPNNWILLTCQVLPPLEELYGNEYLRRICLAEAKILLGTIRKKFSNVQLIGGGNLDTSIGDEGKEELNKIMEEIITAESKAQCCYIV